jgi:multidrug efflux pump subunit AcrA (membrane-fusion protein)
MNVRSPRSTYRPRPGASLATMLASLAALAMLLGSVGIWSLRGGDESRSTVVVHRVERGPFVHEVVERGEIESSRSVEIYCEVKARGNSEGTAILEVVEEGTRVEPGDFICRLDASVLDQELIQQQILCNNAKSLMIQAQNTLETSIMAKKQYLEGTFLQEEQVLESTVFVAEENLRRAQQYLKYSQRLAAKGYVTDLQLEGDEFAVEKAENELEAAKTQLRVLREYTKPKMLKDMDAAIKSAEALYESNESSYQLELSKLHEIEEQITKCTIVATQAGQVVYANRPSNRSQNEFIVEPGALVRERQAIVRLPDPSAMQVKADINESRITLVKVGMPVDIRLDAFGDTHLKGVVTKVNEYPEADGWFSSQIKQYATFIKIHAPPEQIRPGLTAEVKILIDHLSDVLRIPVQAVHEHGDRYYCIVRTGDGWEAREILPGPNNDKQVVIESGLEEGELIAMAPRTVLGEVRLPALQKIGSPEAADGESLEEQREESPRESRERELVDERHEVDS